MLILLLLLIIILIYLIGRKWIEINRRKKIETYKSKYKQVIFSYLTEGEISRTLKVSNNTQRKAIEEILGHYTKVLEGEEEKVRLSEIATDCFLNYYRNRLKSFRWSSRMNALYHIEDFKITELISDVLKLTRIKRTSNEETVHILRILALFNYEKIVDIISNRYTTLSEIEYRNILLRLPQKPFDHFVLGFHESKLPLQKAILDVISIKKESSYLLFTENIFAVYSGELRLRALKALVLLGSVKEVNPYLELLYSSKWEERMLAAKLVGNLKEERGLNRLIELLHDQTWWVRFQAGQAICLFPNGKEILEQVYTTSTDMFAKDMAWEWLHKGV
jgi:hypothetical protein